MFVDWWSVLGLRFGLLILSFYPMGSFILRAESDSYFSLFVISWKNHLF